MDMNLKEDKKVLLSITLPQRETDWLIRQLASVEGMAEKFWLQSLDESGQQTLLISTMEKVTGKARVTRLQLCTGESVARQFIKTLAKRNHPEGIQWMLLPVIDQGQL